MVKMRSQYPILQSSGLSRSSEMLGIAFIAFFLRCCISSSTALKTGNLNNQNKDSFSLGDL